MKSKKISKINKKQYKKHSKTVKKGGADPNNVNPGYYTNPSGFLSSAIANSEAHASGTTETRTSNHNSNNNAGRTSNLYNGKKKFSRKKAIRKKKTNHAATSKKTTNNAATSEKPTNNTATSEKSRYVSNSYQRRKYPKGEKKEWQEYLLNQQREYHENTNTQNEATHTELQPQGPIPSQHLNNRTGALVNVSGNEIYGTHQAPPLQRRRSETQSIVNFPEYDNLINTFKVFVWDFDDTIASKVKFKRENPTLELTPRAHLSMDDLILGYIERNEANVKSLFFEPDFFVNLVSYLTSKGCSVYVASFGFVDNIVQILDALFISYGKTSPFIKNENVLGLNKEAYQSNNQVIKRQAQSLWATKKLGLLDKIINDNPDLGILFFDDNHGNIDANNQKELVYGIKLDDDIGFTNIVLNKVSEYIDSSEDSLNKEILKNIAL